MKILFAASECAPFIKTGGLGDVVGTLPAALAAQGAGVAVVLPKYRGIPREWKRAMHPKLSFYVSLGWRKQYCGVETLERGGVTYFFLDNEHYFGGESVYGKGEFEGERFAFFCRAVLESLPHIGFAPDVLHCNDWQTGLIPLLLNTQYSNLPGYERVKTVFTVHNLAYQGVFEWAGVRDLLGVDEACFTPDAIEFFGKASFMKAGLKFADLVTTVSPTYAKEITGDEFGENLGAFIRYQVREVAGILNGIDNSDYDPKTDGGIEANFCAEDFSGKQACKRALQEEMGLNPDETVPLIAMVTRLTEQKGLDLVECVFEDIFFRDVQMTLLGSGERRYVDLFNWGAFRYPGRCGVYIGMNEGLSRRIFAGADMLLMPSKFEPCGLTQMIAMRYGTLPIVRETGGLADTVAPYNEYEDTGYGFSFTNFNAHDMLFTVDRALGFYGDRAAWARLQRRAMAMDFGWGSSAREYMGAYEKVLSRAQTTAEERYAGSAEEEQR
ncbi:MAG: glycogen synthase GlgA [Christensenellales bacterium]|jgi:starch synthase